MGARASPTLIDLGRIPGLCGIEVLGRYGPPQPNSSRKPGAGRRVTESVSRRRQDILEPAVIRALPPSIALLLGG